MSRKMRLELSLGKNSSPKGEPTGTLKHGNFPGDTGANHEGPGIS